MSRPIIRSPSEELKFVTSDGLVFEKMEDAGEYQAYLDLKDWIANEFGDSVRESPADLASRLREYWIVQAKEE